MTRNQPRERSNSNESTTEPKDNDRRGQSRRFALLATVGLLVTIPYAAEGRSTFMARLEAEALAGPAIDQTISLYFNYFPGDGEAIVRSAVSYDPEFLHVSAASSATGQVDLSRHGEITIDYQEAPLGWGATDTLRIAMAAAALSADVPLETAIYTTADPGDLAHTVRLELDIVPALDLALAWEPAALLPNESATLEVTIKNASQREISGLSWTWPNLLFRTDSEQWEQPLVPGQERVLSYDVRLSPDAQDSIVVLGKALTDGLLGSPLPEIVIRIAPAPLVQVSTREEFLLLGKKGTIDYALVNESSDTVRVGAVQIDVPAGFDVLAVTGGSASFSAVGDAGGSRIAVDEPFSLPPGGSFTMFVDTVPNRIGPFAWESRFRPAGHEAFVKLKGDVIVNVSQRFEFEELTSSRPPDVVLTDLEAVSSALRERIAHGLEGLPPATDTRITLRSEEGEDEQTWFIDELLAEALLERGYSIVVAPAEADSTMSVLSYRLVDARAVYTIPGVGWRSLMMKSAPQRRESTADLLVQLTSSRIDGGGLLWARRINAFRVDDVPREGSRWLGDSEAVARSTVSPDNTILELGLSGLIATGLVLVFFAP